MDVLEVQACLEEYCASFFGHGSWESPVWFIGLEPGCEAKLDTSLGSQEAVRKAAADLEVEVHQRLEAWQKTGKKDIVDWGKYAKYFMPDRQWRVPQDGKRPKIQQTYGRLIHFHLAYLQELGIAVPEITTESVRSWQMEQLGREQRQSERDQKQTDSAIIELMPMPSKSLSKWLYPCCPTIGGISWLADRKVYNLKWMNVRAELIKQRILKYKPKVIVFYGSAPKLDGLKPVDLDHDVFDFLHDVQVSTGRYAVKLPHPGSHGKSSKIEGWANTNENWRCKGREAARGA